MLACMICITPTRTMADWIVSQASGIEADHISVRRDEKNQTDIIIVKGCDICPLELKTDDKTKYYLKEKQIKGKKMSSISGKAGTVIYNADSALTIRVRW